MALALALPLLLSAYAHGARLAEDFTSRTNYDSAAAGTNEAVWNQALGQVHPSLEVTNYNTSGSVLPFSVGDGSDGAFNVSTYASFSDGGDLSGNIIRLNTDPGRAYKFTSFTLASGWILQPTGTSPLVIHSLSDVIIQGTIDCSGGNGGDAVNGVPGSGGIARCGGHNGGAGGAGGADGSPGADASGGATGGQQGHAASGEIAGGGGGAYHSAGAAGGSTANGNGGAAGSSFPDAEFTILDGGAGGGGGAGNGADAGAGGGAGGGIVLIYAARDFELGTAPSGTTGFIFANGGNGGSSNVDGGPGGGGGGGSVRVLAGGAIRIYNSDITGASRAFEGNGGSNASSEDGGIGGSGRSWFTGQDYLSTGTGYAPQEDPLSDLIVGDNVTYSTAAQSVTTRAFDLNSTLAVLNSFSFTPASPNFSVLFAGSNDGFVSDSTGWVTSLDAIQNKRYVKFKYVITSPDPVNPERLDGATLTYEAGLREAFDFKTAGCGRVSPSGQQPFGFLIGLLLLAAVLTGLRLKLKSR